LDTTLESGNATEQTPVGNQEPKQETAKPEIPKRDFFNSGRMLKYAEQAGIIKDDAPAAPPAETKPEPKTEEPCPGCEAKKKAAEEAEAAKAKTPAAREPVISKEDEDRVHRIAQMLKGEPSTEPANAEAKTGNEEVVDLDLVDPAIKKMLLDQQKKLDELQKNVERSKGFEQEKYRQEYSTAVKDTLDKIKKATPFESVVDKETNFDVSHIFYAGAIAALAKRDEQTTGKVKTEDHYMREAGRMMNVFQTALKGSAADVSKFTRKDVEEKFPGVIEEIRQEAIADYLKGQSDNPPSVKSPAIEARPRESRKPTKNMGIHEMLERAKKDPSLSLG
jgi:hypothetical protein